MSIKPVLVPDHDAAALRGLMDTFAEATTGPTRHELAESRAAVAAARGVAEALDDRGNPKPVTTGHFADKKYTDKGLPKPYPKLKNTSTGKVRHHPNDPDQGVAEGFMDTVKQAFNDCVVGYPMGTSDEQFIQGWARAIQAETGRDIPLEKLTKLYQDYAERSDELMQSHGTTNESEHNHDHDDEEGETCPECDGAGCPECYGDEDRDRAHDHAQGMERESAGMAEGRRLDLSSPEEKAARKAYIKAHGHPPPLTPDSVVAKYNPGDDIKVRDYYLRRKGIPQEKLDKMKEAGRPDVMRHAGDTTIRVVKRGGKPIGEIGTDSEASPGNGQYYVKLYDGSYDAVGFDTAEEALAELRYAIKSGMSESNSDPLANRDAYAKQHQQGQVYKTHYPNKENPFHKAGMKDKRSTKMSAYDISNTGPKGVLPESDVSESIDPIEQLRADIRRFAQ